MTLAGKLREANRAEAAVEHYLKVAIAYRSQGRAQQVLAVCKIMLELVPDDIAIHALVAELAPPEDDGGIDLEFSKPGDEPTREVATPALPIRLDPSLVPRDPVLDALVPQLGPDSETDDATSPIEIAGRRPGPVVKLVVPSPAGTRSTSPRAKSPGAPTRKSATFETETPLPAPIPYHIADPTSAKAKLVVEDLDEDLETRPGPSARPPSEPGTAGLAQAARRISGMITNPSSPDLARELESRQHVRLSPEDLDPISHPPPTLPTEQVELDDDDSLTPVPDWAGNLTTPSPHLSDDEDLTVPLEKLATAPIANAFFVSLPAPRRAAALARCIARRITMGTTVIRIGEAGHPLILVVRGQLEVRHDRLNGGGSIVPLETIETGQFIGEAALLARTPAPANIVAMLDSEVLALAPHAVFDLAGAYPALWAALKDSAERRTRQYERILRAQST
ncbi:hypothetical protein BH11MYX1_BH11MYX1_43580 [soil metagenome]